MPESTLSTKGQLVVPKQVREHLGLKTGDKLDFIILDSGEVLLKPRTRDIRTLKGMLKSSIHLSVEDMNDAIKRAHRK